MSASEYYLQVHGNNTDFLSKEAIIAFAEAYAEKKFEEFKSRKSTFNTEQWMNQELLRKKFPKKGE
jgi:hypothetical protein